MEDGGSAGQEPQQEAQAGLQRSGRATPGRADGGGPDLRDQEGREGDVGDERGAGVVDERVYLLSLFAAGLHLEHNRAGQSLLPGPASRGVPQISAPPPHASGCRALMVLNMIFMEMLDQRIQTQNHHGLHGEGC